MLVKTKTKIKKSGPGSDITCKLYKFFECPGANGEIAIMDGILMPGYFLESRHDLENSDRMYVITEYDNKTFLANLSPLSADGNTVSPTTIDVDIPAGMVFEYVSFFSTA